MDIYKETNILNIEDEIPQKKSRIYESGQDKKCNLSTQLKVEPLEEKVQIHKTNWEEHPSIMDENCTPKMLH